MTSLIFLNIKQHENEVFICSVLLFKKMTTFLLSFYVECTCTVHAIIQNVNMECYSMLCIQDVKVLVPMEFADVHSCRVQAVNQSVFIGMLYACIFCTSCLSKCARWNVA